MSDLRRHAPVDAPTVRSDADAPPGFRGVFRRDAEARALYAEAAGIGYADPSAVAVPASAADVESLVHWARTSRTPLVPRGSGSSMAGGAIGDGVAVDLSRLRHEPRVHVAQRRVVAGAGVTCAEINAAAARYGLRFPVDPSSQAFCTIGGMVGTNAAGARSLRVGATRPWTTGVECVFADGTRHWIRREDVFVAPKAAPGGTTHNALTAIRALLDALADVDDPTRERWVRRGVRKDSSGYGVPAPAYGDDRPRSVSSASRVVDAMVGSEGTLALFTAVELALEPIPTERRALLAIFDALDAAVEAADALRLAGASACELLDRTFLEVARGGGAAGVPAAADAVLLIEFESLTEPLPLLEAAQEVDVRAHVASLLCRRAGARAVHVASTAEERSRLWALRHAASPILAQLAPVRQSMQFIEDGCVPPEHFATYVRAVRRALASREVTGVVFGHAGDAHAHVNPLIDLSRAAWRDDVRAIFAEVTDAVVALGGTLAGEHGDGRLRAAWAPSTWHPEARDAYAALKRAADPQLLFNPGCKMGDPARDATGDPFAAIRYDPARPTVPELVRTQLRTVEQQRAWNRFRLSDTPHR
jgi:FAD/FMN-containing dehydrogenase